MLQLLLVIFIAAVVFVSAAPNTIDSLTSDTILQTGDDSVLKNENLTSEAKERSATEFLEEHLKIDNMAFQVPFTDYKVMVDGTSWENGKFDVKLDFGSGSEVQARKKSKIKKVFIPILVFILLKAIVLIPLALGVLGIKTWNALQLSFISFVSSLVLAIWKLCSKINHDHPPAVIHSAWNPHSHDRYDTTQQQMPYSGYASA